MRLVIDTNVLISALIRDSTTRKIMVESEWRFYYPEISFHEVRKYKSMVLDKSGMSETEYEDLLKCLLNHIELVPIEIIRPNLNEAKSILGKIDPDDVVFLAAAMSIPDSGIWSDDRDFEKQKKIRIFKTEDIAKIFSL